MASNPSCRARGQNAAVLEPVSVYSAARTALPRCANGLIFVHQPWSKQSSVITIWRVWWVWVTCFLVTIVASLLTTPKSDEELRGLVWSLTPKRESVERSWYEKPWVLGVAAIAVTVVLNIIFF